MNMFYVQDSRSYVGNDVLWWAKSGSYTTDLSKAETYTQEEAQRMHNARGTDIPWPKAYIDAKVRPAVDMQYIKREEALSGSGIVLQKPKARGAEIHRCVGCGCFISAANFFAGACPKCGTDNRP